MCDRCKEVSFDSIHVIDDNEERSRNVFTHNYSYQKVSSNLKAVCPLLF